METRFVQPSNVAGNMASPTTAAVPAKPCPRDLAINAAYIFEFEAEPRYAKEFTEAEYIALRRIEDGHDVLQPGGKPMPEANSNWLAGALGDDPVRDNRSKADAALSAAINS